MARRHLVIGGGTAGMNAMRTIREEERERSDITLVSAERPYARMVLPYYLDRSIAESHVFTATAARLCRPSEQVLDILPSPQRGAFAKEDGEAVVDARGRRLR